MAQRNVLSPEALNHIQSYKQALENARIVVSKIIVFGSQVKGTALPTSDIDVAIVSPQFGKDYHDESVRLMHIRTNDILNIEPHPFHPDDLNDRWDSLSQEIKKHGIEV